MSRSLATERNALLSLLQDFVDRLEADLDGTSHGNAMQSMLSRRVRQILLARQIHSKADTMLSTAKYVLADLPGYADLSGRVASLQSRCGREEKELFKEWCTDVQGLMVQNSDAFQSGRIMEINHTGLLVVNFSPKLVNTLREVRQLSELGFNVPPTIFQNTRDVEQFYRFGVLLKKVANFYNTLAHQVVDSQRPLLLNSLMAFEHVVHHGGSSTRSKSGQVSWNNLRECEQYVERLQSATEALAAENRHLRYAHETLRKQVWTRRINDCVYHVNGTQVIILMNIDLLRKKDAWKAQWANIRETLTAVTSRYPPKDTKQWTFFWDQQVRATIF